MSNDPYELSRRANLAISHRTSPVLAPEVLGRLSEVQDRLEQARAAPPGESGGMMMGADTTGLEVEVVVRMKQIPTSFVHVLDPEVTPLVTFRIRNGGDRKARLKLLARVEGFSADAIETVELAPGQDGPLSLLPVFFLDRIAAVTESRAASVHVKVEDLDGTIAREATYRVVLLPRTTAYLGVKDGAGGTLDLTRYFAAWVTPNAPEVMQVLREAAALHPEGAIVGYQPRDSADLPAIVTAQVEAIYRALQARELTYVNSLWAFNLEGDAHVQRVRLPRESLATRSANCIDGVVLMASLLEAASLNPAIVLVPGHAFVAFERTPGSEDWDFVETTLLGSGSFADAQQAAQRTATWLRGAHASRLRILPLGKLRTEHGIFPME